MEFITYLKTMVEKSASDLYLTTGAAPTLRCNHELVPINSTKLTYGEAHNIATQLMTDTQNAEFKALPEMNLAHTEPGVGRFRVNIFKQRNDVGMVVRHIKDNIPKPHELGLPPVLNQMILKKHGLLLVVGATGTGKSSTLAALLDYRNHKSSNHIITIEDPIEFIHSHKKSIINQREIGFDTLCYEDALKNALRQAPDVVMIGEIRSRDTMEHALAFADTGHLCVSTLHATNSQQAIERIINFFPKDLEKQILHDLSLTVTGIISQRLIKTVDNGIIPAIEILIGSPTARDYIKKGEISKLRTVMSESQKQGMQTFDEALYKLFKLGKITEEEAMHHADSETDLKLRLDLERDTVQDSSMKLSYNVEDDESSRMF